MKTLHEIGLKHATDKAMQHNFLNFYEKYFDVYRNKHINVLEIGIWKGASLKMLEEYFENAIIYGIDIKECTQYESERIKTHIANQSKRDDLEKTLNAEFDIIIDDGGHKMDQQQISFGFLFKKIRSSGIYVIEDLHTSLSDGYRDHKPYETSTLYMLEHFQKYNVITSEYLLPEEIDYLNANINSIEIFKNNTSITSVIVKK